jgi:hypothetical protein
LPGRDPVALHSWNEQIKRNDLKGHKIMMNIPKSTGLIVAIASLVCAGSVYADDTITTGTGTYTDEIGGLGTGGNSLSLAGLTLGSSSVSFNSGAEVLSFTGGAGGGQIVQGSTASGVPTYVAPILSGSEGSGAVTSTYGTSGINGNATLTFSTAQTYLGPLWGSVDSYNLITFYNGLTEVGTLGGPTVLANDSSIVASGGNGANGYPAGLTPDGTTYVNIDLPDGFTSAVFTCTGQNYNFEFDNFSFDDGSSSVPDGGTTAVLLGGALVGLQALRRKLSC